MDVRQLQGWLMEHGEPVVIDGLGGPATRQAIKDVFVNKEAPAVTGADIVDFALRLGCTSKQIRAVAEVESGGSGFDNAGRPKILFERHIFWRRTNGRFGVLACSSPKRGGYREDSWEKLTMAACLDPDAAFASASWGKFQVMGMHWQALDYRSPIAMAWTMTRSEADHYEALVRYVLHFGLAGAVRRLSTNPEDNRAFAEGYNGSGYREFDYHTKLARAMR